MRTKLTLRLVSALLLAALFAPTSAKAKEKKPVPAMKEWELDVRKRVGNDDRLKKLTAKHPLVLLHSRKLFANGDYKQSAFSFINETSDEKKHRNFVHLVFHNGGPNGTFKVAGGPRNLVVDLDDVDFERNPDPAEISIEHPAMTFGTMNATVGHVYLERIRDDEGNRFYVLFEVVAVDPESRYMAFLWRMLPGGKIVRRQDAGHSRLTAPTAPSRLASALADDKPDMKKWEQDVRKLVGKDPNLKALAGKHPLVLLHSRELFWGDGTYRRSAFSFIFETWDKKEHRDDVQIVFHGRKEKRFGINPLSGQLNFVVELGKTDFSKDPDPKRITIEHAGLTGDQVVAVQGHVYLERVSDNRGNNFYVLFQVVAVDAEGRFMAFLWRKLPGGKVAKRSADR